jgi:AmmeMemoRadiSam system protein B
VLCNIIGIATLSACGWFEHRACGNEGRGTNGSLLTPSLWACRRVKRIFVLGPSHHYYLTGCAISGHALLETPLGDLVVDRATNDELMSTGLFEVMSEEVDSDEHSIEMHLPYIYKASSHPIMCTCSNPLLAFNV